MSAMLPDSEEFSQRRKGAKEETVEASGVFFF
jgi:hypothetical protein